MISKKSDIILLVILLVIVFFLFFLSLTPSGAKETYDLDSKKLLYYKHKALNCNTEALDAIVAHYAVNSNKIEFSKWKQEREKCQSKKLNRIGIGKAY